MLRRWAAMLSVMDFICAADNAPGSAGTPGDPGGAVNGLPAFSAAAKNWFMNSGMELGNGPGGPGSSAIGVFQFSRGQDGGSRYWVAAARAARLSGQWSADQAMLSRVRPPSASITSSAATRPAMPQMT